MINSFAELKSMRPLNNYVVLKPEIDTSKFKYGSVEFFLPISMSDGKPYDAHTSQPIVCSVVSTPRRLIYGKHDVFWESIEELELSLEQKLYLHKIRKEAKFSETTIVKVPIPGSMRFKTTVQVKEGDIVWVNASALMRAEKNTMTIICEKKLYYIIQYEDLYLKKSGKKVKMLNGWVLVEPIKETDRIIRRAKKSGLIIPKMNKKHIIDRLGIVKYIGDPVEYLFDDQYDHPEIKKGDTVMFQWKTNRRLEPGAKFFAKDQDLIVTRRCNLMAIMK